MDNIHPFLPGGSSRLHCPPLSELFDDGTAVTNASSVGSVNVSDLNTTMTFFRSNKFPLPPPPAAMYDARDATNGTPENIAADEDAANAWWNSEAPSKTLRTPERKLRFRRPSPDASSTVVPMHGIASSTGGTAHTAATDSAGAGAGEAAPGPWDGSSVPSDDSFLGEFGVYDEIVHGEEEEEEEEEEEGEAGGTGQGQGVYAHVLDDNNNGEPEDSGEGMEGVVSSQAQGPASSSPLPLHASSSSSFSGRRGRGQGVYPGDAQVHAHAGAGGRVHMCDISSRLSLEATRQVLGLSLPSPTQPVGLPAPYYMAHSQGQGQGEGSSSTSLDESMSGGSGGAEGGLPSAVKSMPEHGSECEGGLPLQQHSSSSSSTGVVVAALAGQSSTGARLGPVARSLYLEMEQDAACEAAVASPCTSTAWMPVLPPPSSSSAPSAPAAAAPALWHTLAYQPSPWPSHKGAMAAPFTLPHAPTQPAVLTPLLGHGEGGEGGAAATPAPQGAHAALGALATVQQGQAAPALPFTFSAGQGTVHGKHYGKGAAALCPGQGPGGRWGPGGEASVRMGARMQGGIQASKLTAVTQVEGTPVNTTALAQMLHGYAQGL